MSVVRRSFSITGSSFRMGAWDLITRLKPNQRLLLKREPSNKADANAIVVCWNSKTELGYVPRHFAAEIAPRLDAGQEVACYKAPNMQPGVCVMAWEDGIPDPAS